MTVSWNDLIGPAVVAAVVSGFVSIIGNLFSNSAAKRIHSDKLLFDERIAEKKFSYDVDLAERKFRYDTGLHDHKRRVEFAEEILAGFYKFKDIIAVARSPAAYGNEGATRPRGDNEQAELARSKDNYFVPLERLHKHDDFLSDFFSKRYRARAMFRADIDRGFQLAHEVVSSIQVAAGMLIRGVGEMRNPALWEKMEADIWDGFGGDQDRLSPKLSEAVRLVEGALGPVLEFTLASNDAGIYQNVRTAAPQAHSPTIASS
jgi:hypothetical protein